MTGNITFTGTVSGIPVGTATQAGLDLKANIADVDLALAFKSNVSNPTFTGCVTTDRLTVNEDTTLIGNIFASGTDKMIAARRIDPPSTASLRLGGAVIVEDYLNSAGGTQLGPTIINGGAEIYGALFVG